MSAELYNFQDAQLPVPLAKLLQAFDSVVLVESTCAAYESGLVEEDDDLMKCGEETFPVPFSLLADNTIFELLNVFSSFANWVNTEGLVPEQFDTILNYPGYKVCLDDLCDRSSKYEGFRLEL